MKFYASKGNQWKIIDNNMLHKTNKINMELFALLYVFAVMTTGLGFTIFFPLFKYRNKLRILIQM